MLIDTNVIISALLKQNDHVSSKKLLSSIVASKIEFFITEFTLFSICIHLNGRSENQLLEDFITQFIESKIIKLHHITPEDLLAINNLDTKLDFDDNVQYYFCLKSNLRLISYDSDFDKTKIKRLTPQQALTQLEFF